MKSPCVTINNLFAGYARAGLEPAEWYALNAEQQTNAQLAFIEVRARILYTLPNDPAYRLPGNVQAKAGELYRKAQEAMKALTAGDAHIALSVGIQAGQAMQGISTQLVAAEAIDVTKELIENEPHILRGIKTKGGAGKGGNSKNKAYQELRPLYQPFIDELYQKNTHQSYAELQRKAAAKFNVSVSTIKDYTKNPTKKVNSK